MKAPRTAIGLAAAALLALGWTLAPAPAGQDVAVTATHVAGSVWMLEGQGGNIGLCVADGGSLLVDDQFANLAPKIRAAVEGVTKTPLRWLLNTHHHGDHTGGNAIFGKDATILAHDNVRVRLLEPDRDGNPPPAEALPVLTYEDGVTLFVGAERVRVHHVPAAHTDGDSVVHFVDSDVWHLGDLFFSGRFPYIDLEGGGSVDGYIAGIEWVLGEMSAEARVVPGHGPLSTRADLETTLAMLKDCRARVAKAKAEGMTYADMMAADLLADYEGLSWQFINTGRFLETLSR